jgi:hypothetical protein
VIKAAKGRLLLLSEEGKNEFDVDNLWNLGSGLLPSPQGTFLFSFFINFFSKKIQQKKRDINFLWRLCLGR